jgi:hypothetical protein
MKEIAAILDQPITGNKSFLTASMTAEDCLAVISVEAVYDAIQRVMGDD